MRSKTPKLTEKETQIMSMLWEHGPMFVREMLEHYDEPRPHFNTVSTTVRILEDKGYVGHTAVGASHRYYAAVPASEFRGRSLAQVVKSYFNNSYTSAVSALVEEEKISVDELRRIIDMVEQRNRQ
ncbi:MAG: BlaI/MecI/CopY family transcriptional regulator [Muribaculaceae bacterium]|nr:BlaI/MecI/CopY family transcriptional regulator [Muribaculaceae bacterium]